MSFNKQQIISFLMGMGTMLFALGVFYQFFWPTWLIGHDNKIVIERQEQILKTGMEQGASYIMFQMRDAAMAGKEITIKLDNPATQEIESPFTLILKKIQ